MKVTLTILSLFCIYNISNGQKQLTTDEIFKYWTLDKTRNSNKSDGIQIMGSDTVLYQKTKQLIDSLHSSNIDSIIIYTIGLPGYFASGKCLTGSYPITSHIIWKMNNEVFTQMFEGKCSSKISKISNSELFTFYDTNISVMMTETFMPRIYGAELSNNNVHFSMTFINHEPQYSILYKIDRKFKSLNFTESDLEDEKSLFHNHNLNLKGYTWWTMIKKELNQ